MSTKIVIDFLSGAGKGGCFTFTLTSTFFGFTKFSLINKVSNPEIIAGINAHIATARTSPSSIAKAISAMPGPITAPILSPVRWNPNALPRWALSTESAIKASRGALRMPLPMRSVTRPRKTRGQDVATTTNALPTPANVYPEITKGLRPKRSLDFPLINLVNPAAASAHPSIRPRANGAAPITPVSKIGSSG